MSEQPAPEYEVAWGQKTLTFTLSRSSRKTMGIEVHPNLSVRVLAPEDTPIKVIEEKVRQKAGWILKQQGYFLSFHPLTPPRRYVSGETHLYLGRQYRLWLRVASPPEVKLQGKYIHIWSPDLGLDAVRPLLDQWYEAHAQVHFAQAVVRMLPRFARFDLPGFHIHIQKMDKRWGSCSPQGRITLNLELIQAPKACIEYVVAHELCHLIHPDHTRKFFALLATVMPDWAHWKERLERTLG